MRRVFALTCSWLLLASLAPAIAQLLPPPVSFGRGDVFVSLEPGPVQWRLPDGTLRAILEPTVPGLGEGMAFDAGGNLYVARWRSDSMGLSGNTIERFNTLGISQGTVGQGFDCDPHAIVFDSAGSAFVGQAGCRRSLLKFVPGQPVPIEYLPAEDYQGLFWIDLAPDNCTIFYTSYGRNVKRYDTCARAQLPDFNDQPLPGAASHDLRVLPDGGVLVSSGRVIARLNRFGAVVRTYEVPGDGVLWAGLDLTADGGFWVADYYSSNVFRFDLASGAVLGSFNTGTPANTAVGVRVMK